MKTLITEHWAGQQWGQAKNVATRVVPIRDVIQQDARALFELAYPTFAGRCRAVDEPGLAVIAVDEVTGQAAGMACLRARVDRHVSAIVGRHDKCDLYLAGSERLALRHVAVILGPVTDWRAGASSVSFRVLDLRTGQGVVDETGRALRGLRSEGPAIVRCGGYALFLLPLGDPTDWPASAAQAWAQMPERVYHDELVRAPEGSALIPRTAPRQHTTLVTRIAGPRELPMLIGADAETDKAGWLALRGEAAMTTLTVGRQALTAGVLLGRYDRCDAAGLVDESVSRVHALLLLVDDRLLAIDIASTNGTRRLGGSDARVIGLDDGTTLELGHVLRVHWSWAS